MSPLDQEALPARASWGPEWVSAQDGGLWWELKQVTQVLFQSLTLQGLAGPLPLPTHHSQVIPTYLLFTTLHTLAGAEREAGARFWSATRWLAGATRLAFPVLLIFDLGPLPAYLPSLWPVSHFPQRFCPDKCFFPLLA